MLKPRRPCLAAVLLSHDQGAYLKVIASNFIKVSTDLEARRAFEKKKNLFLSPGGFLQALLVPTQWYCQYLIKHSRKLKCLNVLECFCLVFWQPFSFAALLWDNRQNAHSEQIQKASFTKNIS